MVLAKETNLVTVDSVTDLYEPLLVIGIPAFNEEKTIARVVLEAQKHSDIVVVCDDGSSDPTGEIAERLGATVIRHEHNGGYGAAMQSLFKKARELNADVLVTLDSDGQHDPAEIPRLVKPFEDGVADVVLGSRFMDKNGSSEMPAYRKLGVRVITKLTNGNSKNCVSDAQSGFRAYGKLALDQLSMSENGMSASIELLLSISKKGLRVCEVPISTKYPNGNVAKTSSKHPVVHGVGLVTSLIRLVVEDRPLAFLGIPGMGSLIAGILFGIFMMNLYVAEGRIVTNVALASIGFLLLGCFMISTAITLYAITRINAKIIKKS